jgi:hypothetical protein
MATITLVEQQEASSDNGQTGSTDVRLCSLGYDEPCTVDVDDWRLPEGRAELVRAACVPGNVYPTCECRMRRSRLDGDDRPWDDGGDEVVAYLTRDVSGCSQPGRTPSSCLYCTNEFMGCSIDDTTSCDAACADMAVRYDADMRKAFSIEQRVARCADKWSDGSDCVHVTEIDGLCYARDPAQKELPSFDCSLSNAQILEHRGERHARTCEEGPEVACETSSDCPHGRACGSGLCVACTGHRCADGKGGFGPCAVPPECVEGERCVLNACVPELGITCESFSDCLEDEQCVLSGMDFSGGRGNASTRTLCMPHGSGP